MRRVSRSAAVRELTARLARESFLGDSVCTGHHKELAFVDDSARRVMAMCGRRSGKTTGAVLKLMRGAYSERREYAYVTLARNNAKTLCWPTMVALNERYKLGATVNYTDLSLEWGPGAGVWLRGANNEREIEKIRGHRFAGVIIDEPQSFPAWLGSFIAEIVTPTLMDYGGWLGMIGTPPEVWVGEFCRAWDSGAWSTHHWTAWDNPHVDAQAFLSEELERRGVDESDPAIQREFFGKRSADPRALVYRYGPRAHAATEDLGPCDYYVLAYDIGFDDADAIALLGWRKRDKIVRLVREEVHRKQTISDLGEQLLSLWDEYRPIKLVGDLGALGKKAAEEMRRRYGLPIEAAERSRKLEHIALLNDAMTSGRFIAAPDSQYAHDCARVRWDRAKLLLGEYAVDDHAYHSDICDAVQYGYRVCSAYLEADPGPELTEGEREVRARIDAMERRRRTPWWQRVA